MTLQQLRYIIEIAETGSITMAAQRLFIAQPSLSKSVAELEKEMGITIFNRSNRGVYLSEDGTKFLSYARQIVEQTELLENEYKSAPPPRRVFAVSAQHYAFVVNAFVELVREYGRSRYEFTLRELKTAEIIEDIRTHRSDIGILFLSSFNREVIRHILQSEDIRFEKLFTALPHVFVSKDNPLVGKKSVTLSDLRDFPRLTYDQGVKNSFYFAEELHITEESPKNIVVSDRATLFNLLIGLDGYTISSGILSADLNGENIVAIPLESDERMDIGYITTTDRPMNAMTRRYLEHLTEYIENYSS
ncbi:DNA-binding transcriptional regulator, LysR family [Ruminococcus sp. YE71]|uniref:LysR family transcriptional regulator n=1 Tax=unclassified Ruminococcus TaxID=2608920 RepID=UPI00088EA98A|nr:MULTISPECIES: LysR family transcriptional regulator [unclassified Ruminococcus]SDA22680.1 DNA-binding transcriptional regulator, LysR family [Ruminococcus sp. YE78]SFW38589.1 DNA-binding transcriptional regulator, LysR family [Ruminococcus sp. YE71]